MKQADFDRMLKIKDDQESKENYARRSNTSWIEVKGFIGIEHMTPGAYLFRHEMGLCWVPKAAIKFERKVDFDKVDTEYRVLMASWFNFDEKIKLMKEGKLVSDAYLENRMMAERALRPSIMPKTKTLKGQTISKYERPESKIEIFGFESKEFDFNRLFERIQNEEKTQPGGRPKKSEASIKPKIFSPDEEKIRSELKTLRDDLNFFEINNSSENVIDSTKKKIMLLILEKKEKEFKLTYSDRKFFKDNINTLKGEAWQMEYENGVAPNDSENLNRAIDL